MDTWLSRESKSVESSHTSRAALNKLNSIKARLRNARSEVYCTLQVSLPLTTGCALADCISSKQQMCTTSLHHQKLEGRQQPHQCDATVGHRGLSRNANSIFMQASPPPPLLRVGPFASCETAVWFTAGECCVSSGLSAMQCRRKKLAYVHSSDLHIQASKSKALNGGAV